MARKEIPRELSIYINDKQVVNSFAGINRAVYQTNNEIKNLNKNSETYNEDLARLKATLTELTKKQTEFKNEIKGTTDVLDKIKNALGPVASGLLAAFSIGSVISGFSSALKGAYKTINEFEQSLADLSAITGATGKDLKYLKEQAIILGESTKGGAQQVVEAYKLIASAKPELLDNIEALNQVTEATLTLSQAAGMELPEAATALTDALNQFNAPAEQAGIFVDALANGAKYGAAEIPEVTDALLKFGAVAKTSNIDIKESTALIELLAENGLKGAEAGTALRNVLLKLSAPDALPKEARQEMDKLGISLAYLKDKTVPIQEKLEALKPLLKDNASIVKVFGTENAAAAINVISHTDRLKELTSKMGEVGTASEQASIKMDTVNNKTELLKAKYDSLILSIGSGSGVVSNFFKFFINGASSALDGLIELNATYEELRNKQANKSAKIDSKIYEGLTPERKAAIAKQNKEAALWEISSLNDELEKAKKDFAKYDEIKLVNFFNTDKLKEAEKDIERINLALGTERGRIKAADLALSSLNKKTAGLNVSSNSGGTSVDDKATEEEKVRLKKLADAKKKVFEEGENAINDLIFKTRQERSFANLTGLQKDIAQVTAKYAVELEKFKDHKLRLKEIEALRDQEINDLKIAKAKEYNIQIIDIEKQIAFDKEVFRLEQESEKATSDEERQLILVQKARFIADYEIQTDLEKELAKVENVENAEALKQAIRDKYAQKKTEVDNKMDIAEKAIKSQQVDWTKLTEDQKLNAVKGALNGAADALNKGSAAWKAIKIAETTIATYQSAVNSYNSLSGIPIVGPALGAIASAFAVASGIAQVKQIASTKIEKAPKLFYGGFSGSKPHLGYDEYGPMTGVVHKNEYVIPEAMTQSPRYANTIAWLEQERTGNSVKKFASGGASSSGVVTDVVMSENDTEMKALLRALLNRLDQPLNSNVIIGYNDAKAIQDLNDERAASDKNSTVSS